MPLLEFGIVDGLLVGIGAVQSPVRRRLKQTPYRLYAIIGWLPEADLSYGSP
ncbi:hypothetical protein [Micromonospora sp. NPDC050695]|uniref:hypothetical protein n=1 Tax=Micromonospora sp. NPDC050695 TaxID=3154938 RepID=UPI0033CF765A